MEDLRDELAGVWDVLRDGAARRKSGFHTFALATVAPDGTPDARTVILRGADAETRTLTFNSDIRSPKFRQLRENPNVVAVFYSVEDKLQIRVRGLAEIHHDDPVAAVRWEKTPRMARETYCTPHAPGAILPDNPTDAPAIPLPLTDAYQNFALVIIRVAEIEWLFLSAAGHRRARVRYAESGEITVERLAV